MTFKEFLEKLGIAEDNIENATKQFKEFLDGEYVPKSRFNEINVEKKNLETAVADRDKQLKALKDSEGDVQALKDQITKLQADNKANALKAAEDLKALKLSTAVQLAIGDSAQDAELVANLIDKSKLILADDGKVTGLDEQLKDLQKNKAFLFKPQGDPKFKYDPNKGEGVPKVNPFSKEHFNLTQQAELIKTDAAQAKTLAAQAGVSIDGLI